MAISISTVEEAKRGAVEEGGSAGCCGGDKSSVVPWFPAVSVVVFAGAAATDDPCCCCCLLWCDFGTARVLKGAPNAVRKPFAVVAATVGAATAGCTPPVDDADDPCRGGLAIGVSAESTSAASTASRSTGDDESLPPPLLLAVKSVALSRTPTPPVFAEGTSTVASESDWFVIPPVVKSNEANDLTILRH